MAMPLLGQSADQNDIDFDLDITQEQFAQFARIAAQAIYHTPVEPARAGNLVPVDTDADYWQKSVGDDFTVSDHIVVPRLVVSKGLSVITVSGSYAKVQDTDIQIWGAAIDVPIINGGLVKPTLALRGSYAQLQGIEELDLKTAGVELFLSKGFGPITPYAAFGLARSDAEAVISEEIRYTDESDSQRITVGVKVSMLFPKIVVEATQAEERSYAAKVSFGF
jgi:hypothetical protein